MCYTYYSIFSADFNGHFGRNEHFLAQSYIIRGLGDMITDINYYAHNSFGAQRNIHRHEIKFHELTFLIEGEMTYFVNDEPHHMHSGDIIYLPAGSFRQRDMGEGKNDYISINFHSIEKLPLKNHSQNAINTEVKLLLDYFDLVYADTTIVNKKKMGYILDAIILQISENLAVNPEVTVASQISAYLSRHYQEKITLEDISREMFFSTAYCESEFRKATGKSIIHYLIDLRINEAKKLLTETSMSCAGIAIVVGFEDANYFSRIFKKRTGYSPLKYRENIG